MSLLNILAFLACGADALLAASQGRSWWAIMAAFGAGANATILINQLAEEGTEK